LLRKFAFFTGVALNILYDFTSYHYGIFLTENSIGPIDEENIGKYPRNTTLLVLVYILKVGVPPLENQCFSNGI